MTDVKRIEEVWPDGSIDTIYDSSPTVGAVLRCINDIPSQKD
jgi:hypothetical protein